MNKFSINIFLFYSTKSCRTSVCHETENILLSMWLRGRRTCTNGYEYTIFYICRFRSYLVLIRYKNFESIGNINTNIECYFVKKMMWILEYIYNTYMCVGWLWNQNKTENLIIFQNAYIHTMSVVKMETQQQSIEDKNKKVIIYFYVSFFPNFFSFTFNESGVWQHQNIMNYWEMFQQLKKMHTAHSGHLYTI